MESSIVRGLCSLAVLEAHRVPSQADAAQGVERELYCLDAEPGATETCADAAAGAQGVERELHCLGDWQALL